MDLSNIDKDLLIKTIAYARRRKNTPSYELIEIIKNTSFSKDEIKNATREYELTIDYGARFIPYFSAEYPENLRNISRPPVILTSKGNISLLKNNSIAIVGSRTASFNGLSLAKSFSQDLRKKGFTIVSGLAKGIDAQAHLGSIDSTIAIIGSGINVQYPKDNEKLYEEIFKNNSLIATEFPFDFKPIPANFPSRNRIIAGISLGCLVVEAGMQSGSLSTARMALESNRQVFAIPGFAMDSKFKGNNHLIKKNVAKLVDCVDDILDDLNYEPSKLMQKQVIPKDLFTDNVTKTIKNDIIVTIDNSFFFTPKEKILSIMSNQYIGIDEICGKTGLPIHVINMEIIQLELSGDIISNGINGFCRKY